MNTFKRFKQIDLSSVTNFRNGEVKFGEKMIITSKDEDLYSFLKHSEAKYVLIGVPEDIGVRANLGKRGASTAWEIAIQSIANIQHNKFCKGNHIIALGIINIESLMVEAENLNENIPEDRKKLFKLVEEIDKEVSHAIYNIRKCDKIPIIIGGGHNNSYGNIKGIALANGKAVNAINFDAHSDFRILEGRHSGNGFSYAYNEGFLKNYFIFGLHESYTSKNVLDIIKKTDHRVIYNTYDEIKIRQEKSFENELNIALEHIKNDPFGIEIDLDAIPYIPSSAMTISGFSVEELRKFIYFFAKHKNAAYLHICEGAPTLTDEKSKHLVGKLITYLITDFIKGNSSI